MGCTASKDNMPAGTPNELNPQKKPTGTTQAKTTNDKTKATEKITKNATNTNNGALKGVNGLNALGAEKLNMSELVDKEKFSDVYELGQELGRGNFSQVRKGIKKDTGEVYAIKCIQESKLTDEDRDALKIETQILRGCESPYIIKLYGFYEEVVNGKTMYYIVTELVSGGELFDRIIEKEYYNESDAQEITKTIAQALKYCHDRGVVHRDLKPENILLKSKDDDNSIKIADFGFAKQYDTSSEDALATSCGTPGYVAPEILSGKKYGKQVDMWSLGVILYILLCGYPPFHHENQKALFKLIKTADYKFDEEYWNQVSNEAKDLISQLLVLETDDKKRLTVDEVLSHEWLSKVRNNDISSAAEKLRARRKFKGVANAVIANNRMQKLLGAAKSAAAESNATPSKDSAEAPKVEEAPTTT